MHNMYHNCPILLALPAALLLSACDGRGGGQNAERPADPAEDSSIQPEPKLHTGTLQNVSFRFDPAVLVRTEIELRIPPSFDRERWATKLVPHVRAAQLGKDRCSYGTDDNDQTCTAKAEIGVALALLERPIDDYRAAFAGAGASYTLQPVEIGGMSGFAYLSQTGNRGTEYSFLPTEDRTLLISRRFDGGLPENDAAISAVIASIRITDDGGAS